MNDFSVNVCTSFPSWQKVLNLLSTSYQTKGLLSSTNVAQPRLQNLLIDSRLFFAAKKNTDDAVACGSILTDSTIGLRIESLYGEEINEILRSKSFKIAEVSQLATSSQLEQTVRPRLLIEILGRISHYAATINVDVLCVAIDPSHKRACEMVGFQTLGHDKIYPLANNAPRSGLWVKTSDLTSRTPKPSLSDELADKKAILTGDTITKLLSLNPTILQGIKLSEWDRLLSNYPKTTKDFVMQELKKQYEYLSLT